ncbi:MAG TPA: hypothetical protein VGM81_20830 [Burkholderiaceae bacterium]
MAASLACAGLAISACTQPLEASVVVLKGFLRRQVIQRRSLAALNWLESHGPSFRIDANAGFAATVAGAHALPWQVKPLTELLFLLLVFKRHDLHDKRLRELNEFVLQEAASFDWHALLAYDPSAATPLAMITDFFLLHVRPPPFETEHFDALLGMHYFLGVDRVPYRDMDLAYSLWRLGHAKAMDGAGPLFAETAFGKAQRLARYSIDDIYSLTHAIFYLTDLGHRRLSETIDPKTEARLRRDLIALTAVMLRADNCDVLGELLLGWRFCRLQVAPHEEAIFQAGVDRIIASMMPDGSVPSTARGHERALARKALFTELYHTTLVSALLLSMLERPL